MQLMENDKTKQYWQANVGIEVINVISGQKKQQLNNEFNKSSIVDNIIPTLH